MFQSLRREHGVDTALVLGYEGPVERDAHYGGNNAYIAHLARTHDWMSPLAHTAPWLDAVPGEGFRGIAAYLMSTPEAEWFSHWTDDAIDRLAGRQMVVSLNVTPETLTVVANAIRRLEGCHVLVSHLGQPGRWREAPSGAELVSTLAPLLSLADIGHVGVKVSGLYDLTDPAHGYPHHPVVGVIDRIADAFGCERLYWGSDFSPALDYVSFAQTVHAVSDLSWSQSEREAVMGGNLRRLLRSPT